MKLKELTAPCGIDCFNCELYEENITDEFQKMMVQKTGKKQSEISCKGCRQTGCVLLPGECATSKCVKEKNLEFCFECSDFPCQKLSPCKEGADRYPHNLKLYNLCRIQLLGIEKWSLEAKRNRENYFKGRFVIGQGPVTG
jgi:hypothetical protein